MANFSGFFKKMKKGDFDMGKARARKKARDAAKKKRSKKKGNTSHKREGY